MTAAAAPRVILGMLGMDQHETGAIAVARLLRDAGMEVVYLGRFNLPEGIAAAALQEAADVIGISCHSWEYLEYLDELRDRLRALDLDVPIVLGGSVITPGDARAMQTRGVAATFGPAADPAQIVETVGRLAAERRQVAAS